MIKRINNIYIIQINYFKIYVIKGKNGDILIDTGFIFMKHRLKHILKRFNIKLIIITHAHVDHIWNAKYLKELFNCEIAISNNDINNIDNSNINAKPTYGNHKKWTKLMNLGMKTLKAKEFDIDIRLKDNQIIKRYGITLKIVSLTGHTNGSIGVLYKNYLFAGDAMVNRIKPTAPYQSQNPKLAKESFEKILNMPIDTVFLGHDRPVKIKTP